MDFCQKYGFIESNPQSLPDFIGKLKEKKQTTAQQKFGDLVARSTLGFRQGSESYNDRFRAGSVYSFDAAQDRIFDRHSTPI